MVRSVSWLATVLLSSALAAAPAAAQTAKKVVRIHTAGPNDLGVDNTLLALEFTNYVNANSDTVEVKLFPTSQLGQTREVIEAMRLGSGASATTGGPAEYASFVKRARRARPAVRLEELRPRRSRCSTARSARSSSQDMEKAGFKVLVVGGELGLPQRRHGEEGSEEGRPTSRA